MTNARKAAVAFGAILLDRPALTMRGLALAALIIVLWMPESVLEPGFQMSFAATAALVAAFEAHQDHARRQDGPPPAPGPLIAGLSQIVGWLTAALATSFIAGLATEPFALHHFQRLSFYGLVANLAVTPIVAFVVTPSAVLAALGAVFGAAEAPLEAMAASLDLVLGVAEVFGGRPEAVSGAPATPEAFLPLAAMGIAWATLWRGWLRLGAAAWLAAALALWALTPPAVIALDAEAQAVFARVQRHGTGGTEWALARGQARSAFARERLGGLLGLTARQVAMLTEPEGCAASLCRWRTPAGRPAFLVRSPDGFLAACRRGAIVASRHDAPVGYRARCGTLALFDGTRLRREGGVIVREGGPAGAAALTFTFARPAAIRRAWTAAPPPAPRGTDQ